VFYPIAFLYLLNPVTSDSEIGIGVGGLPCVTRQTDLATNNLALSHCVLDLGSVYMFKMYIETLLEPFHLLLECLHNHLMGLLS